MLQSEFFFEKKLRANEVQICDYFKLLPQYLDLPNEEEFIFKIMSKKNISEQILSNVAFSENNDNELFLDDDNQDEDEFDFLKSDKNRILSILDKFNSDFLIEYSKNQLTRKNSKYLKIICKIGILSHYLLELVIDKSSETNYKICICKRALKALNQLVLMFKDLNVSNNSYDFESLHILRERIIAILIELRAEC